TWYDFDCAVYCVDEGDPTFEITINRKGDLSAAGEVEITTTDLSAIAPTDYTEKVDTLVDFPADMDSATVSITIASDSSVEHDEHFLITLNDPVNGTVGDLYKTMVIIKDTDSPETWYDFDCAVYCVDEGDPTFEITINRKGDLSAAGEVEITTTDLSAIAPTDYTEKVDTLVDFPADMDSATVSITIASDSSVEHDEHFLITLNDPVNGTVGDLYKTMVIIKDTDSPETWYDFDCAVYCVDEGDPTFEITINRKGDLSAAGEVEITTTDLSAIAPTDYTEKVDTLVDFPADMDSATVSITIASDSSVEHDEHFLITLNDPVNGTVGDLYKTMVIIKDTDSPETWYDFDCAVYCVDEGDPTFEITINRKGDLSAAGEVEITTTDLSAIAPTDYTEKVDTLVDFPADMDSATVSITIASDSSVEHDEHFLITLNDPVNGTVGDLYKTMVIIKDTDSPETWYDFDCAVYCVDEGDPTFEITINRKGDLSAAGEVEITTTDLSAIAPTDYTEKVDTLVDFPADMDSATVSITIASDSSVEHDEHFLITLNDPVNGTVGDLYKTMVIIKDTDSPETWYDFDCAVYCVDEGDPTFEITINRKGDLSAAGEVEITTTDLSAIAPTDYTEKVDTLVDFPADMDSATVSITIASDSSVEHDEHFLITLNDPVNGTVGDLYKTMVIIKDTDSPATWYYLDCPEYYVEEAMLMVMLKVIRVGDLSDAATVTFTATDQSAKFGSDYGSFNPADGMVTFLPNEDEQTIVLNITDDNIVEGTEQLEIRIEVNGSTNVLGQLDKATVTIFSEDTAVASTQYYLDCAEYFVAEDDGSVTIRVVRRGDITDTETIRFTAIPISAVAEDFENTSNPFEATFMAGSEFLDVSLPITDDVFLEDTESLIVTIEFNDTTSAAVLGHGMGQLDKAVVNIFDDDS
ncbi:extracellular matrix protein 3-like, partial [Amphiura filiformis]|uniref:extracellular matrix protein 3-like n=1 Tax=Amphiura filiformis TaxID=82378 RepID=UPI003B21590A